nr:phosphoribosylaminoimidazolesuccinocarboxamide synthase [Luteibaculum oceani]
MMDTAIKNSNFNFHPEQSVYNGKVRDVYSLPNDKLVMVASDRISAFDVILPRPIPYKGQVLNATAIHFLKATEDICPNWFEKSPHPNVSIGKKANPFKVEMVIRGYLAGHAWREYKAGKRILCGVVMPDGMRENQKFPEPIITPATKAEEGHDEDISREEILAQGIVSEKHYLQLEKYTRALFARGTEMAANRGLILVDTKYEFGLVNDEVVLIDEIHTPDSSRYFYADVYDENLAANKPQKQLSKEFVREWLMENGFQGKEGDVMPEMTDEFVNSVTNRYIELYENITGETFKPEPDTSVDTIEALVQKELN